MEIITQMLPREDELLDVADNTKKKFVYEPDTYAYFLHLYEHEIDSFIKARTGTDLPPIDGDMEKYFDRAQLRLEHLKAFSLSRKKFHLYKGDIYIYRVLHGNVGHEVEAIRLNDHDTLQMLNELSEPPPKWHIRILQKVKGYLKT